MQRLLLLISLAATTGCGGVTPLTPAMVALLEAAPTTTAYERAEVSVDVESEALAGTFTGVMITGHGPRPMMRLQLFGDVGGMVLDVSATRRRIVVIAGAGARDLIGAERIELDLPHRGPTPPSAVFAVASLLEAFGTVRPTLVKGMREDAEGITLARTPNGLGINRTTRVDSRGRPTLHRFRLYHRAWRVIPGDVIRLVAPDLVLTLVRTHRETLFARPVGVFAGADP